MSSFTQPEGASGLLSLALYNMYKKRFTRKDAKCDARVWYEQWLRICKKFNTMKMHSVIRGEVFNMPFRLGSLGIIQYKKRIKFDNNGKLVTKGLVPDWEKTYKLWRELYPWCEKRSDFKKIPNKQVVFRTNEHTDGRIFRFHWKKKYCNIKNISAYELNISARYKQELYRYVINHPNVQYCEKF